MDDETVYQDVNETIRQQFESSWIAGKPQPIEVLIGDANAPNYLATLEELVHIELEFRWKNRSPLQRVVLEDYLERFQQLNQPEIVNRLVQQEVRLRTALGELPTGADYGDRFPDVAIDTPISSVAQQDTEHDDEDQIDTRREMATIMPSSGNQSVGEDTAPRPDSMLSSEKHALLEDAVPGYDLLGELGRGGMGVVYKARDQKLKRIVALKMILSGAHASDEDMQRFQTEAEAVARLQHPNIVQIYEVAEHGGNPYIALEFADAGNLDEKIAGTPQNARESAQLLQTLALAIEVAHQQSILHRDLKPANVLLTGEGEPKITDFGLAKRMDEDSNQTKTGAVMGTPSYMAPEQAANSSEALGPTADVYSLGAILYHLLTGRPPFQAATQLDTLMQVINEEPVSPRRLNKSLALDLETICLKCLEKPPHKRYATAAALASDLDAFINDLPITARPINPLAKGIRWARRNTYKTLTLALLLLVLAVIPVYQYLSNQQLDKQHVRLQLKNRHLEVGSIQIIQKNVELAEASEQLRKQNVDLGLANEEVRRQVEVALFAEYVATVNLVDQDTKVLSFRSAKQRIDRFNQRITADSPDPRGVEWQQLSRVVANSFTEIIEPSPLRIRSFAASPSADVVLYNVADANIAHSNRLRLYDAVQRQYLCDEPLTIPEIGVDSRDGPILQWVGGRTFVIGNQFGLFALTVREGVNETTPDDIKTLDAGDVYGITGTGRSGEFMVVYVPREEAASPVLRTKIWQLNEDEPMVTFTPAEQLGSLASGENGNIVVKALAISPDRQYLAVARGEFLEIRDLQSAALLSTIQAKSHTNSQDALINDVTFVESNEGLLIAFAGNNKMVELFMIAEQGAVLVPQRELRGHTSFIQSIAYDRDSGWLLSASNDQSIFCWSPFSGERNFVLAEHDLEVIDVSFTEQGHFILSASLDGRLIIRERASDDRWSPGEPKQMPGNIWSSFCVLPSSDRILIGGGQRGAGGIGSLSLVDVKTQQVLDVVSLDAKVRKGTPHPTKPFVMVPLINGEVVRCDIRNDKLEVTPVVLDLPESLDSEKDTLSAGRIVYVPSLQRFYVGMMLLGKSRIGRGAVALIDEEGRTGTLLETQVERGIYSMAISPEEDRLAIGTLGRVDTRPQVWVFHIGEDEKQLQPASVIETDFQSVIYDLAFHPDGGSLYVAGNHKNIQQFMLSPAVFDEGANVTRVNSEVLYGHSHDVVRVAISESGRRLISFGYDGLLCVWDMQSGQLLTKKEMSGLRMFDMAQDLENDRLWLLIDDQIVQVPR